MGAVVLELELVDGETGGTGPFEGKLGEEGDLVLGGGVLFGGGGRGEESKRK